MQGAHSSSVCGFSLKHRVCERQASPSNGYWTLVMDLGPVNHKESFLADIFVPEIHTICV